MRGELKIRGYSSYLHPVGGNLLLGIGQDATDEGRVLGVQASLFDVSDLRRPRRLDALSLGPSWSAAENDHHAFLWWPRARLAVIPVVASGDRPFTGALGLTVDGRSLSISGRVAHVVGGGAQATEPGGVPILRSLVVGSTLYTVSELGREGVVADDVRGRRLRALQPVRPHAASVASPGSSGGRSSRQVHCAGILVGAEAQQLRAVPEPPALHLVVAHLDDELRAEPPPPRARRLPSGSARRSAAPARRGGGA